MSILDKIFGGGRNNDPAAAAQPYLNQIPGVGHQAYDPYIQQGQRAGNVAEGQYNNLVNDPTAFINKILEMYKPSEGYQYQKEQLGKSLSNTAAAGGISGTPLDQQNQGQAVQGLLSNDMQQFLQNILGRYDKGLEGEQGLSNQGFKASGALGDVLGNNLSSQAGLAFQGAQQKNSNRNALIGALAKALGLGAGAFFGAAGGPAGAVSGASAGSQLAGNFFGG